MSEQKIKMRHTGIFARLCTNFNAQAMHADPSFEASKIAVKEHPWISNHPWSENGIPESFEDLEFCVLREMREEEYLIMRPYDNPDADSFDCASRDIKRLLNEQRQKDLEYAIYKASPEEQQNLLTALDTFINAHINDEESPYYGTYAPYEAAAFKMIFQRYMNARGNSNNYNDPWAP